MNYDVNHKARHHMRNRRKFKEYHDTVQDTRSCLNSFHISFYCVHHLHKAGCYLCTPALHVYSTHFTHIPHVYTCTTHIHTLHVYLYHDLSQHTLHTHCTTEIIIHIFQVLLNSHLVKSSLCYKTVQNGQLTS